jgi:hypothetical protein
LSPVYSRITVSDVVILGPLVIYPKLTEELELVQQAPTPSERKQPLMTYKLMQEYSDFLSAQYQTVLATMHTGGLNFWSTHLADNTALTQRTSFGTLFIRWNLWTMLPVKESCCSKIQQGMLLTHWALVGNQIGFKIKYFGKTLNLAFDSTELYSHQMLKSCPQNYSSLLMVYWKKKKYYCEKNTKYP